MKGRTLNGMLMKFWCNMQAAKDASHACEDWGDFDCELLDKNSTI